MNTNTEVCHICAKALRGNPNSHQCENCSHIFCSEHARLVEWGIRMCVNCKPKTSRRSRNGLGRRSRWAS